MTFGSTLKQAREQLGISQKTLAGALEVSFCTINRWENGHHAPSKMAVRVVRSYFKKQGIKFAYSPEK